MIVATLLAATVATAAPDAAAQPSPTAPATEKKMACCEKMAKGEGCDCCKDMGGKAKDAGSSHEGHDNHAH